MDKKRKPGTDSPLEKVPEYGNPEYDSAEDIYNKDKKVVFEEEGIDDTIAEAKIKENPLTGEDLDIPGAELDDANEAIGEEDEENNYYSLGGDEHNDLEADNG